jgi:hypothetical protein
MVFAEADIQRIVPVSIVLSGPQLKRRLGLPDEAHAYFYIARVHITPQHCHGITGEFDWFRMPAELMRRLAAWNLNMSYESFWFDHPEWSRSRRPGFFGRILQGWRSRPNKPAASEAAITSQLAVGHHCRVLPDPGTLAFSL